MTIEHANGSTTGAELVPVADKPIDASTVDAIETAQVAPTNQAQTRKSVERELAEIADHRRKDRRSYFKNEAMQARELELITLLESLKAEQAPAKEQAVAQAEAAGELDPALSALVEEWESQGGREFHEQTLKRAVDAINGGLDEGERKSFARSFDALPTNVQSSIYRYLSIDGAGAWPAAKDTQMEDFRSIPEQAELVAEWGSRAAKKVGTVRARLGLILRSMSDADRKAADAFIETWSPAQAKAILRVLAG